MKRPDRFEVSISFQGNKTPGTYRELAQLVDRYDFDVVSVYNDLLYQPALGPLLLMAPHIRRARIGPAALNPFTVHPVEIAGQLAFLDLVTGGRAYLGLARGAWLEALGRAQPRPLQTLRETVLLVRHLLARRAESFDGEVFQLAAGATLGYAPYRSDPPITIGTWGVRTARMAGELADEVKVGGSANPGLVAHLRKAVDAGAETAGRTAGAVGLCLGAVTVVDSDRTRARQAARRAVALYLPVVARLDPTLDDPEWLAQLAALEARGDRAAIASAIPEQVLDRFAFSGTVDDVTGQTLALAEAGATRVEFGTPLAVDHPEEAIRLLGERLIPTVQESGVV